MSMPSVHSASLGTADSLTDMWQCRELKREQCWRCSGGRGHSPDPEGGGAAGLHPELGPKAVPGLWETILLVRRDQAGAATTSGHSSSSWAGSLQDRSEQSSSRIPLGTPGVAWELGSGDT